MTDGPRMTDQEFAGRLARIAQKAAAWSADCLDPLPPHDQVAPLANVRRFTDDIRKMLDGMERDAA